MKKTFLALAVFSVLVFTFSNVAFSMKIGICPVFFSGNFNEYDAEDRFFGGYDNHSALGIDLSIAQPIQDYIDIQAGYMYLMETTNPMFSSMDGGIQESAIYVNARVVGSPIKQLGGIAPYFGVGLNYPFITLTGDVSVNDLTGNIGYQGFVGAYINGQFPVELGWMHTNASNDDGDGFLLGIYLKGGYCFNL